LPGQTGQIIHGAVDLAPCTFKVRVSHQWGSPRQTPAGAAGDSQHEIQITQQFFSQRRRLRLYLLMGF
jgi:hypothetical protein